MPRPVDITSLGNLGPGSLPKGSVEDSSLRNPDRDTLPLTAHVTDPSRAHMASSTGVVDAGEYYASDEVEGVLQEIGGTHSEGRQNGAVTGFGYTDVGLVVTFDTPSSALVPILKDFSGESLTLPDNIASVWVYIDPSTKALAQVSAANPPSITSPENLLLWQFTTAGGVVTAARDARLYVRNLDRKLPLTVRASGAQADQESEACFVSLEAAMIYLQYSASLGSVRTEVIIRGPVTSGSVDIPVDGVQFRGEDATITMVSGAGYLFDLQGHGGVSFFDLTLATDVGGATAIIDSVGVVEGFSLTRCEITSGLSSWVVGVDLPTNRANLSISGCYFSVTDVGILVDVPDAVLVDDTVIAAINFVPGSMGISIGSNPPDPAASASTVRGCSVTGFDVGVSLAGVGHTVTQSNITPGNNGTVGVLVLQSQDVMVTDSRVDCSVYGGQVGVRATGTFAAPVVGLKVLGCSIYGAGVYGIDLEGFVQESKVQGNHVDCYLGATPEDPTAEACIYMHSAGLGDVPGYNDIQGNTVWRAKTGIYLEGASGQSIVDCLVSGNVVHHCAVGVAGTPSTLFDVSTGIGATWCDGLSVFGNNIYGVGYILQDDGTVVTPTPVNVYTGGVFLQDCTQTEVSGNLLAEIAGKGAGKCSGVHFEGPGSTAAFTAQSIRVSGNTLSAISGAGVFFSVGSSTAAFARTLEEASIFENRIIQVEKGILVTVDGRGSVRNLEVSWNTLGDVDTGSGISIQGLEAAGIPSGGILQDIRVNHNSISGTAATGIEFGCENNCSATYVAIEGNTIRNPASEGITLVAGSATGAGPTDFGQVSISNNSLLMTSALVSAISWESVADSVSGIKIEGNQVFEGYDGISLTAIGTGGGPTNTTLLNLSVSSNTISASRRGFYGIVGGFADDAQVVGNLFETEGTTFSLALGAVSPSATASNGLVFTQNKFTATTGANTQLQILNMKVNGLRFESNLLYGGDAASLGGLSLTVSGANTGLIPSLRDVSISGNTFRNMEAAGIYFSVAGPTDPIINTKISSNTFDVVATDAGTARASVVLFSADALIRNMQISDNQVSASGHGATTHGGFDLTVAGLQGLAVSGNQFNASTGASSTTYGNFLSIVASTTLSIVQDLRVTNNQVRGVEVPTASVIGALVALDLRDFTSVENVAISNNDFDRIDNGPGNTNGVRLWCNTTSKRISITQNVVTGVDVTSAAFFVTLDDDVDSVTLSNNQVSGDYLAGSSSSPGVGLYLGADSRSVRVSNNTFEGAIGTLPSQAILVDATGALTDLFVDKNDIYSYENGVLLNVADVTGLSLSGNAVKEFEGIALKMLATGACRDLTFEGNRSRATSGAPTGWDLNLGTDCSVLTFSHNLVDISPLIVSSDALSLTTGSGTFKNFVFTGNVFRGSTGGITYTPTLGVRPDSCTFMGNIGDDPVPVRSWSQFENGSVALWTNVLPPAGLGAGQFQTFNIDNGT